MRCTKCAQNEAVIQLTHVKDNETTKEHLCEACAAENGVEVGAGEAAASAPLTDFLAQMGKGLQPGTTETERCPTCGLGTADLKRTGRLGCAACYTHFAPHLRGLLRRLHGGTQHVGKQLVAAGAPPADPGARVQTLRRSLQRAVEAEDFERAAQLRDQIRLLESGGDHVEEEG